MTYLDTHIAAELAQGDFDRLSRQARKAVEADDDLRLSPMAFLELEFLHEIGRLRTGANEVLAALHEDLNVRLCESPFTTVAREALSEGWTRDPFDRLIVAHARAHKARLITRDLRMHKQYRQAFA